MTVSIRYLVATLSLGTDTPTAAILSAVAELGHVPLDLRASGIIDFEPWETAQRHIERSDYLVVVVGHAMESDKEIQQVTRTFDSAIERDVPVMVLIPSDLPDSIQSPGHQLVDKMVENPFGMTVTYDAKHNTFAGSLGRMIDTYARPGFVSTSALPSDNVAEQLTTLIKENDKMRALLGQGPDTDAARHRRETVVSMLQENKILIPLWYRGATSWGEPMEMSLYDFFLRMGPELASEVSTDAAAEFIPVGVCGLAREDFRARWPVPSNNLNLWFTDLMAIGVVEPSLRKRSGKDQGQYWTLTEEGRKLLSDIRRSVLLGGGHRHIGFTSEFPVVQNIDADL